MKYLLAVLGVIAVFGIIAVCIFIAERTPNNYFTKESVKQDLAKESVKQDLAKSTAETIKKAKESLARGIVVKKEITIHTPTRQEKIEFQFSAWNGAHRALKQYVKGCMNDPGSFKHYETRYKDNGDSLTVIMSFGGRNAFGGMVRNTAVARVSISGDVLECAIQ